MLNRFENKTRKRSWKIRMHRRMKPWKLRWYASRGSFPLRNLRPYSAVDGDCLFVSFSQGVASVGIQVGPRKLRKVAWQMLRRDNCAAAAWDGFLPCSGLSSRDWSEYLGEIRTSGSWASLLEAKVMAEAFQVNVCITNGYVTKSFCQEPTSNKHFHLKFCKQHYMFVPQQRTSDRDFLTSKLRQWCKLFSFVPFSRKQVFESWRGGSAKATARKRDTREAMRALKNIKLPGQFAFLSPLIPMLVDLLALHPSKLTVKPKKKKKTKAKPIPHAKPDAVQKDATAEVRPPCWYHQKGCCKFGDSCWYSHSHVPPQQSQPAKAREEVESKTSPSKSSAFLPWDLRKDDWNGEIHSLASFSNRLDQLSTTSKLHAVVKVDSDKELDTIKELLAQSDYDQADLQVAAAQPCQNPVMAAANGHDIVFAPVRSRGTLKPRALILHQMTNTCSVTLVSQKIRQASATPEAPKTVVLRIAAEERFCSPAEWKIRKNAPAQMAQKWAQRQVGLNKCKRIHDAWGFTERFYKSSVVMGLMRVDKDLALDLTAKSGIEGWFCEPLNWQDADVPNPAIRWMSKADDESEINYLQRVVAEKAAFGITRGEKQLGARTKRDTSVAHARTWTVQGAPDSWTQETLENILQKELPMQNVTCISRRKERKGRCSWTIRATTLPDQDYFDLQFKDFHLIAFVITTRARPNFSARTLPQRRTMQFSDGQGDLDMQSSPPADPVAPAQLESSQEEQSGEKQDQDMKEPAQKHAASPHKEQQPPKRSRASELTVHQNPPAHMNLITNTGGGDCLFLTCAQGINEVTKREKPVTHRMLRASICKTFESKPSQYKPFWDEKCPSYNEEPCNSWEEYISKLKKVGAWGGHLEMHAIAALYNVQINVLTPGGVCNTVNEKSDTAIYLWLKGKHYELLQGAHPTAWIQDLRAAAYTGGRGGGGKSMSSEVHTSEADSQIFGGRKSGKDSVVQSSEIDSEVVSRNRQSKNKRKTCNLDTASPSSMPSSPTPAESHDSSQEHDVDKSDAAEQTTWQCPICSFKIRHWSARARATQKRQHLLNWHPLEASKFLRANRWAPQSANEEPSWCRPCCPAKLYGKQKSDWDLRISHWKKAHPKEPREKILDVVGQPKGTPMKIASFAKRNALVAKNIQILKGDCNGHKPTEIVWPFSNQREGVVKKFACTICLKTAHLSKLIKSKCPKKLTGRRTRCRLVAKLQEMISKENNNAKKQDL